MLKGYIYRHWIVNDKGEEKSYIGQVCNRTPEQRWRNGQGYKPRKNEEPTQFYIAIEKYGWHSFTHDILLAIECETEEELVFWTDEWEKYYIEKYDSFKHGYNMTLGGGGTLGRKHTEETRKKQSEIAKEQYRKGRKPNCAEWSEEQRKKQSETWKKKCEEGYVQPFKGKHHTEEWKKKHVYGEANPMFGKKWDEERKMYTKKEDYVNPFKGKHHTEESKRKISEAHMGQGAIKVICLNTMTVYDSIKDASEMINVDPSCLAKHCKGKQKSCGKLNGEPLVWVYYEDYMSLNEKEREQFRTNKLEQAQPKSKYGKNKRAVICLETKEVYESCKYVRNHFNLDVQKCCSGQRKTCGGYHWMYYDEYLKLNENSDSNSNVA